MPDHALAELIIDHSAIAHNTRVHVRAAQKNDAHVMAILKADAYNHGVADVIATVLDAGATHIGVATIGEALSIHQLCRDTIEKPDIPVTCWMWYPGESMRAPWEAGIIVGIPSLAHARDILHQAEHWIAEGHARPVVQLMMDTGLSRSGISPDEWQETIDLFAEHQHIVDVTGIFTHLATADDACDSTIADRQKERFERGIQQCHAAGLPLVFNHAANTPATLTRPDLHYQGVRPGVGLYGVDPMTISTGIDLRPAMTFRAKVISTRIVRRGEGISYGHTFIAPEDIRTAVVAMGYADGVPRSASGKISVVINGQRYPQIGRVCMDQIVVNLGPVANYEAAGCVEDSVPVKPGDWAVLFGADGPSIDELAAAAGTIAYEILTLPRGARVRRRTLQQQTPFATPQGYTAAETAENMRELGISCGEQLRAGDVVILTGPLGAGKTTFTQGVAQGLGVKGRVQSPTFTLVRTHKPGNEGAPGMLHMDAYRLLGEDVIETIEPGRHLDSRIIYDAMESLDIDADLHNDVLIAEWGRGVVESIAPARILDVEIHREEAGDAEDRYEHDLEDTCRRTLKWSWYDPQRGVR